MLGQSVGPDTPKGPHRKWVLPEHRWALLLPRQLPLWDWWAEDGLLFRGRGQALYHEGLLPGLPELRVGLTLACIPEGLVTVRQWQEDGETTGLSVTPKECGPGQGC